MIQLVRKRRDAAGAAARGLFGVLWAELRRLNAYGLSGCDALSRRARAAQFRAALERKYRGRSPCC